MAGPPLTPEASARVAVLVPWYKAELSPDEETSLAQLDRHLGHLDRLLVAPEGLAAERPGDRVTRFPARCFADVPAYNRLLVSRPFYERFAAWDFVLVHQLDCLVFSDDLLAWCDAGWDYVGAPWWRDPARPELGFSRVGNGGLSLRRVAAALRVLDAAPRGPLGVARDLLGAPLPDLASLPLPRRLDKRLRVVAEARRGAAWYAERYTVNEDRFWSDRARLFDRSFRVPPPEVGLEFAFERAPRACFEANGRRLPFGAHAWGRYDRDFWVRILEGSPP